MPIEGAAIAIICLLPIYYFIDRRLFKGFLIGPLLFSYMFHAFGYALGPLWQIYIINRLDPIASGFYPAQWGGFLGLLTLILTFPYFFHLGQKWLGFRKSPASPPNQSIPKSNWTGYSIILLVAATSTILLGFLSGVANRLGGEFISLPLASIVSAFANVSYVAFFFLGYAAARYRGIWWLLWVVSLLFFSIFYFLDGGRGAPVYAAIFSAMGMVWGGYLVRRIILIGLLSLLIFIPFVGVVELYRDRFADLPSTVSFDRRISGFSQAIEQFSMQQTGSIAHATEAFARALTARTVDRIFLLVPRYIPYAGLEGLDRIYYAFVPAILQPNRPVLLDGNDLAIRFGAATPNTTGSYTPTVGDGYRRGGWVGVVLLYGFTALIYGFSSAYFWERRDQRVGMAMFVFLTFQSPGIWSTTLLSNFYFLLWLVPRNFFVFWFLRFIQDFFQLGGSQNTINRAQSIRKSRTFN
jgi:hypothetical protein